MKQIVSFIIGLGFSFFIISGCSSGISSGDKPVKSKGKIVFTKVIAVTGKSVIYVMDADGKNKVQLTEDDKDNRYPIWSPDGTKIVFENIIVDNVQTDIYVMDADGSNRIQLSNMAGWESHTVWSPDSTKIAYISFENQVYILNADGTGLKQITTDARIRTRLAWSFDGTKISYTQRDGGSDNLYIMGADGSDSTFLTETNIDHDFQSKSYSPMWSSDSTKILFQKADINNGVLGIYIINVKNGIENELTNDGSLPVWSPDNTKIVFIRNSELYLMDADGSGQTFLLDVGICNAPSWSADSAKIAFSSNAIGMYDIYSIEANGSNFLNLSNDPINDDDFLDW